MDSAAHYSMLIPRSFFSWQSRFWGATAARGWQRVQRLQQALVEDWHGHRYGSFGLLLLLITSLIVAGYYLNHPQVELYPDTRSYLNVAQHILANGDMVDPGRTPGYPLLMVLVFLVAGQGNLEAVSVVQGILFVVATLEIYLVTCLILRRAWIGLIVGLMVGTNILLLSFTKPAASEGFALWVVASLALAVVLFIRTLRVSLFWLVAFFMLVAFMTRAEWVYAPIPFFAYFLALAVQRGKLRRLLPHVVLAAVVLYGCLGLYIYVNATQHNFPGITEVQSINLLGKVMEYHMQDEAPPHYAAVTQQLNAYLAAGGPIDPYGFGIYYPAITSHHWALADAYASTIVDHHPIEFALDTVGDLLNSSNNFYQASEITPQGVFAAPLSGLEQISAKVHLSYRLFPVFALFWFGLLLWRRSSLQVQMMAALAFLGLYELAVVAAGAYASFPRLHTPFDPIMLSVIWGSVFLGIPALVSWLKTASWKMLLARTWPLLWWAWGIGIVGGLVLSPVATVILHGTATLAHPGAWTGIHWVVEHPIPALAGVGIGGIFTLLAYYGYLSQQRQRLPASPEDGQGADVLPQRGEASEHPGSSIPML